MDALRSRAVSLPHIAEKVEAAHFHKVSIVHETTGKVIESTLFYCGHHVNY